VEIQRGAVGPPSLPRLEVARAETGRD